MHERERVVQNSLRLLRGALVLGIPILVTEQYRKGLGATVSEVAAEIPGFAPVEKTAFSACGAPGLLAGMKERGIADVILCGIEAHVCVCQTGLDLLDAGLRPFAAGDAISSRTPENKRSGLDRLRDAGATVVSTEMVLFELLGQAGGDAFKAILELVR